MKTKIQREIERRKRMRLRRLRREQWQDPDSVGSARVEYEMSERATATSAGGIGLICNLVRQLGLAETIHRRAPVLLLHAPYSDAGRVLNIAFDLLAGGRCLESVRKGRESRGIRVEVPRAACSSARDEAPQEKDKT